MNSCPGIVSLLPGTAGSGGVAPCRAVTSAILKACTHATGNCPPGVGTCAREACNNMVAPCPQIVGPCAQVVAPCSLNQSGIEKFVPVCASVICEAPGVIYVSIDPDVWKIRCRQCQEKTEHKCALKKLKSKFRSSYKKKDEEGKKGKKGEGKDGDEGGERALGEEGKDGKKDDKKDEDDEDKDDEKDGKKDGKKDKKDDKKKKKKKEKKGEPMDYTDPHNPDNLSSDYCICADRPRDQAPKANVCLCDVNRPVNFLFEVEVTGEFKPAHVPRSKSKRGATVSD